jgi:transcriptional regulator with XRE-family HTH domain
MMSDYNSITPAQARAARALLAWSQKDLASAAQVGLSTIADFEREARIPVLQNLMAMRRALEQAGVEFIPVGRAVPDLSATGLGVRLLT